ncbi:guanitoxin biosynthesis heme-dependent pre-guanitoxin N-hydroxylase GntA [Marivirga sp.]|uniref:guanitoxin biosynthesis heme-dependent pre-guanitoxin N-hydroxylase GntA n=1 Tax=Marivirga sp. TaxID=2018662 RepID=UPI002D7E6961|nr:guanitoxin biosynthesis heme-dependent pre-guanitoxin N-hydroxylase GntA [Marivirga sp.]HET8859525.1 guanitoxin biosynthesis heme-dependent pre-guanitoxin N-hydroxylase GntA [Marivirga sp.]
MEPQIKIPNPTQVYQEFEELILEHDHPCVMAQSSFKLKQVEIFTYEKMGSNESSKALLDDLKHYIDTYDFNASQYQSLLAVFPSDCISSEQIFEEKLWTQLHKLHLLDDREWDNEVSNDPENAKFSFSVAGKAFYIVGMHPKSSRFARRSPYPTIVFNFHSQFEQLKDRGVYHEVRDKIRSRDKELQGTINPVVSDFGEISEARQYSGRNVEQEWKCPFHPKP